MREVERMHNRKTSFQGASACASAFRPQRATVLEFPLSEVFDPTFLDERMLGAQ